MTLLELSEPLFQYICRLSRSARKGVRVEPGTVRNEVKAILGDMRSRAMADRALVSQYEKIELVYLFFVDFMVRDSLGAAAKTWQELAAERKELAGDERFFDMLDETLKEPGDAAAERLVIYYVCIGLGFTGWYTGQPEYLRKKMLEISSRIRHVMDSDQVSKICPEAYEHVNTANLVEPPGRRLVGVGIVVVGLLLVVFAANVSLYLHSKRQMTAALDGIVEAVRGKQAAKAGEGGGT
jgi:type IV/VI secretion system ImpK/VasF family protein